MPEIFPAMLAGMAAARVSIRLEIYTYAADGVGRQFLAALVAAGGAAHHFNPLRPGRFGVRDHRKLLVCDEAVAFVGGFNLAEEYAGDGVAHGWFDLGARLANPALAAALARSFDELFALADFRRRPFSRLRGFKRRRPANYC